MVLKVYRFDGGTAEIVCVRLLQFGHRFFPLICRFQYRVRIVWRPTHVPDGVFPTHDRYRTGRPGVHPPTQVTKWVSLLVFSFAILLVVAHLSIISPLSLGGSAPPPIHRRNQSSQDLLSAARARNAVTGDASNFRTRVTGAGVRGSTTILLCRPPLCTAEGKPLSSHLASTYGVLDHNIALSANTVSEAINSLVTRPIDTETHHFALSADTQLFYVPVRMCSFTLPSQNQRQCLPPPHLMSAA